MPCCVLVFVCELLISLATPRPPTFIRPPPTAPKAPAFPDSASNSLKLSLSNCPSLVTSFPPLPKNSAACCVASSAPSFIIESRTFLITPLDVSLTAFSAPFLNKASDTLVSASLEPPKNTPATSMPPAMPLPTRDKLSSSFSRPVCSSVPLPDIASDTFVRPVIGADNIPGTKLVKNLPTSRAVLYLLPSVPSGSLEPNIALPMSILRTAFAVALNGLLCLSLVRLAPMALPLALS